MRLLYKFTIVLSVSLLLGSCNRDQIAEPVDDSIPPVPPSDLTIFAAYDGQVGMEWGKNYEFNLKGYFIYRSINRTDHFEKISFTDQNYFIDDSLSYDSTYYYKISAVNQNNMESPFTLSVSAKPVNMYAPLPPNSLTINARNWTNSVGIKIFWEPSTDTDIFGYKIYRGVSQNFVADSLHYLDFTTHFSYIDTFQIEQLTNYYYKIIAVDKGGLKSQATEEVTDLVLNSPKLVYPANNSIINSLTEFRIKTASKPAKYKLVILSNEIYGTILEINFSSDKIDEEIKVDVTGLRLDQFKTFLWRVYTYTASEIDPNSYSALSAFTYFPSN